VPTKCWNLALANSASSRTPGHLILSYAFLSGSFVNIESILTNNTGSRVTLYSSSRGLRTHQLTSGRFLVNVTHAMRSLASTAVVALLAGASLVAAPTAAQAATCTRPTLVSSSTTTPVVTLTPTTGARTQLSVRVANCPGWGSEVHFNMDRVAPAAGPRIEAQRGSVNGSDWVGTQLWDPYDVNLDRTRLAGTWKVRLTIIAISQDFDVVPYYMDAPNLTFSVLNATTMAHSASAKSVRKGKSVTFTGQLKQADLETHTYVDSARKPVQLQFKTPTGAYKTLQVASGRLQPPQLKAAGATTTWATRLPKLPTRKFVWL
jgi:hypothetical protein